jgi:hypothetical protein
MQVLRKFSRLWIKFVSRNNHSTGPLPQPRKMKTPLSGRFEWLAETKGLIFIFFDVFFRPNYT